MNLADIVGGSVDRWSGINDSNYQSTGLRLANSGEIRNGYQSSGFRVGGDGNVRDSYGNLTDVRMDSCGTFQPNRMW